MVRWVLVALLASAGACSSSTTNEGAGGTSSGGASGAAGQGGGSGSGGQAATCTWESCGAATVGTSCNNLFAACNALECGNKVKAYQTCVCGGSTDCLLPTDNKPALDLIQCLAKDKNLSPTCFHVDCVGSGNACSITGVGEHCCEGFNCLAGTCK